MARRANGSAVVHLGRMARPMNVEKRRIARHIANLSDADRAKVFRARRYLIYYGVRAMPELIVACDHESPEVRLRAAWALAHSKHPDAYDSIRRLCSDSDEAVRYDCRVALGILGDERGLAALMLMIEEGDDEYAAAHSGIGRMLPEAFPAIAALFRRGDSRIRDSLLNLVGVSATDYGLPEAIEFLQGAVLDENSARKEDAQFFLEEVQLSRAAITPRNAEKRGLQIPKD